MPTLTEYRKLNRRRVLAAAVCSLGGLIFGYDLGALSSATQSLRGQFGLSAVSFGWTVSASLWGTICASLPAGHLADRVGRRSLIAACSLLYALAAIGLSLMFTPEWHLTVVLRLLSGMAIGGFTVGCPLYLAELAPSALRGRFVSLFQLQIGVGVVLGFGAGSFFAHVISPSPYWRWCFGLGAVPAAALLLLLPLMPETPRWLVAQDKRQEASREPEILRTASPQADQPGIDGGGDAPGSRERLFSRKYARPILLAASVAVFNQLSGVNILLLYLLDVLSSAGLNDLLGHTYTVFISCFSLVTTALGMACVDKLGRKPLLIMGSAGLALCLFSLGFAIPYHTKPVWYLVILVAYNGFFAFSQGVVVWVYLSELFPFAVRGAGQGFGASVLWIVNALLIWSFPALERISPSRSFYFFSFMMVAQIVIVLLWYPETKGTALGSVS